MLNKSDKPEKGLTGLIVSNKVTAIRQPLSPPAPYTAQDDWFLGCL